MDLDNIGFYTLTNKRAIEASIYSNLKRCEILLTKKCNFKCPYCRNIGEELSYNDAIKIVRLFSENNLENIRFSGGEPTLWPNLNDLIKYTKDLGINRIALSTNGSADFDLYKSLYNNGVNDFSISLDACCASDCKTMGGGNYFEKITENIKNLSNLTYVTVGVVLNDQNKDKVNDIISFASSLNVSDIRVIPAAQYGKHLEKININEINNKYKILKYRLNNLKLGKSVRGLNCCDCKKCGLVLDDIAVKGNKHYPCIIYMREYGKEIGTIDNKSIEEIRIERFNWYLNHDSLRDNICSNNCLDVCIEYNNKFEENH